METPPTALARPGGIVVAYRKGQGFLAGPMETISSRDAPGGNYQCRLGDTEQVDARERTPLLLCLDSAHRRLLQEQLGGFLLTCSCPLLVWRAVEDDPGRTLLVDRCPARFPRCCRPLILLQRRIRRAAHQPGGGSEPLEAREFSWGRDQAPLTDRLREICHRLRGSSQTVTLGSLAVAFGVSPRQLNRHFHAAGAASPMRAFRREWLREAIELIRTASCPVEAIADDLGYSDRSSFSRAFRRAFGFYPAHLRKPLS